MLICSMLSFHAVAIILLFELGCCDAVVEQRLLLPVAAPGIPPEDCLQAPQSSSKQLGAGLLNHRSLPE